MAEIHRFPVLLWEDAAGQVTAALLDDDYPGVAYAPTPREAIQQLKQFIPNYVKEKPWLMAPSFTEPVLSEIKVPVRPEFRHRERRVPSSYSVTLHLPVVTGLETGIKMCRLPTLGIRFYYHEKSGLRELILHYVRQHFTGATPQLAGRFLKVSRAWLQEVSINIRLRKRSSTRDKFEPVDLSTVADPLTARELRKRYGAAWEREDEVKSLVEKLRKLEGGLVLVGESGCGKTTLLIEAARQMERRQKKDWEDEEYAPATHHLFWLTAGQRMIAGMQWLGQWERRAEDVIADLESIEGLLCVENLLDWIQTGGSNPMAGVANFFQPYLARKEVRLVLETTPEELGVARRLLPGFTDLLEIFRVAELDSTQSQHLLQRLGEREGLNRRIEPQPELAPTVYRLFHRHMPYAAFPGQASSFLTQLFRQAAEVGMTELDGQEALNEFIRFTGLPRRLVDDRMVLTFKELQEEFRARIVGQDTACDAAAQLVVTVKAGMNDPNRPLGVLLFCGPTGVGKTELSKQIAKAFFGGGEAKDRLIRLDMSEYRGWGAAERLLRQPNGSPSQLVQRLRRQPFQLVLLDEIEKADPEVFDLFLGVFDEGRMRDIDGRSINFRSTVIIMTSNLGASATEAIGFGEETINYEGTAMQFFRPEFFNRMDAVVTFSALSEADVEQITELELRRLSTREGLTDRRVKLSWDTEVVRRLATQGYDRRYGARPLQRVIEEQVMTPLANALAGIQKPKAGLKLVLRLNAEADRIEVVGESN